MNILALIVIAFAATFSDAIYGDEEKIDSMLQTIRDYHSGFMFNAALLVADLHLAIEKIEKSQQKENSFDQKHFEKSLNEVHELFNLKPQTISKFFFEIGKEVKSSSTKDALHVFDVKGNFNFKDISNLSSSLSSSKRLSEENEKVYQEMLQYARHHLLNPIDLRRTYVSGVGAYGLCELVNINIEELKEGTALSAEKKLAKLAYLTFKLELRGIDVQSSKIKDLSLICKQLTILDEQRRKQFLFKQTLADITLDADDKESHLSYLCDYNRSGYAFDNTIILYHFVPEESAGVHTSEIEIANGKQLTKELIRKCRSYFESIVAAKFGGEEKYLKWAKLIEKYVNEQTGNDQGDILNAALIEEEPTWNEVISRYSLKNIKSIFNIKWSPELKKLVDKMMKEDSNHLISKCNKISNDPKYTTMHDTIFKIFSSFGYSQSVKELLHENISSDKLSLLEHFYFVKVCKHLQASNFELNSSYIKFNWRKTNLSSFYKGI